MPRLTLHFTHLIQDSQDFGGDDEHMVSRVFFDIERDGKREPGFFANIKQPIGGGAQDEIEVSKPEGVRGPFDYGGFRQVVEQYFRGLVGAAGVGIRMAPGAQVRMRNNRFNAASSVIMEVPNEGATW